MAIEKRHELEIELVAPIDKEVETEYDGNGNIIIHLDPTFQEVKKVGILIAVLK